MTAPLSFFELLPLAVRRFVFCIALLIGLYLGIMPEPERLIGESLPDKLLHAAGMAGFGLLIDAAYPSAGVSGKIAFLFFYGFLIELIQIIVPGRNFSLLDVLANTTGLLTYFFMIRIALRACMQRRN